MLSMMLSMRRMKMTKLKTLKDIKEVGDWEHIVRVKDLRQEAIKWVEEHDWIYDAENDKGHKVPDELELTHVDKEFQAICNWIKHFFNISEDDFNK